MIQVFNEPPQGIQVAPHEVRMAAVGYQVSLREVNFAAIRDKDTLMLAFLSGLGLTQSFGRNWDALYDVLTDPSQSPNRFALLMTDYVHFKKKRVKLAAELESVLLDAQAEAQRTGRQLWLLAEEADSDTSHW